jgi:hypothetical protein
LAAGFLAAGFFAAGFLAGVAGSAISNFLLQQRSTAATCTQ